MTDKILIIIIITTMRLRKKESRAPGCSSHFGIRLFSHLHKTPADTKNTQVEM